MSCSHWYSERGCKFEVSPFVLPYFSLKKQMRSWYFRFRIVVLCSSLLFDFFAWD